MCYVSAYTTKPEVITIPGDLRLNEGDTVTLTCTTSGVPAPVLVLTRRMSDVIVAESSTPTTTPVDSPFVVTLTYSHAVLFSDKASAYVCSATNSINTLNTSIAIAEIFGKNYVFSITITKIFSIGIFSVG